MRLALQVDPQKLNAKQKAFAVAKTFGTEGSLEEASNKNYFFFLADFFAAFFFVAM